MNHKVSYCIPCKGRAHQVKKTLPQNIEAVGSDPDTEFVLLDYGSEDGLGDWVKRNFQKEMESGLLVYARLEAEFFRMTHAKNVGHRLARGRVLCNLEADNILSPYFTSWLNEKFLENPNIVVRPQNFEMSILAALRMPRNGYMGRIAIAQKNFYALEGYDERFSGWGAEDKEFYVRAMESGLTPVAIPIDRLGGIIDHSNEERLANLAPRYRQWSSNRLQNFTRKTFSEKLSLALGFTSDLVNLEPPQFSEPQQGFGCATVVINFGQEERTLSALPPVTTRSSNPACISR